jgi:hypothetical protein
MMAKNILFSIIFILLFSIKTYSETVLEGTLSQTLELSSKDNPILIEEHYKISNTGHLIVNSGVIFQINDDKIITVEGQITCKGNLNNYIKFIPAENNWGGIIFKNKEIKSILKFVEFSEGYSAKSQNSVVYTYGSNPIFEFCKFETSQDICNAARSSSPDFGGGFSKGYNYFSPGIGKYAIINNGTLTVNAKNNCWSDNPENLIFDKLDNTQLGEVFYDGIKNNCDISALPPPVLIYPINNVKLFKNELQFIWSEDIDAINYTFQMANDSLFNDIISEINGLNNKIEIEDELIINKKYYWRVRADNEFTTGTFSQFQSFFLEEEFDIIVPTLNNIDTVRTCISSLKWAINGKYDYFQLEYWNLNTGNIGGSDSISTTDYQIFFDAEGEYTWRVRTALQNKFSAWSDFNKFIYENKYEIKNSIIISEEFKYLDYIDDKLLTFNQSEESSTIFLQDNNSEYLDTLILDLINIKLYGDNNKLFIGENKLDNKIFTLNINSNKIKYLEIKKQSKSILFSDIINFDNNLIQDNIILFNDNIKINKNNILTQTIDLELNSPNIYKIDINNDGWEDILLVDILPDKIKIWQLKNNKINYELIFVDQFNKELNGELNDIEIVDYNIDNFRDIVLSTSQDLFFLKNINGIFFNDTVKSYKADYVTVLDENSNNIPEFIVGNDIGLFSLEFNNNSFTSNNIFNTPIWAILNSNNNSNNIQLILEDVGGNIIELSKENCSRNTPKNTNMSHVFSNDLLTINWENNDNNIAHEINLINKNTGDEYAFSTKINKLIIKDLASGNYDLILNSKNINDNKTDNYIYSFKTPDLYGEVPSSWDFSTMTGSNSLIKIDESYFDNNNEKIIDNYDAIGVFYYDNYELKSAGYTKINTNETNVITCWKDNSLSAEKDGFYSGEKYVFKIWNAKEEKEEYIIPKFISGPDYYLQDTLSIITQFNIANTQEIDLKSGWNYLTLNINPIQEYLSEISEIALYTFLVDYSDNLNIQNNHAMQIYSKDSLSFIFVGDSIQNSTRYVNKNTWKMLPYYSDKNSLPQEYLKKYLFNILLIKDEVGNIYYDQNNFNSKLIFQPNKSYKIIYKNDLEIDYLKLAQDYSKTDTIFPDINTSCGFNNSGVNMNLIVELNDSNNYQKIEVYNFDRLAACQEVNEQKSLLTVWGNDYFSSGIDQKYPLDIIYIDSNGNEKLLDYSVTNMLTGEEISFLEFSADAVTLIQEKPEIDTYISKERKTKAWFSNNKIFIDSPTDSPANYSKIRLFNSFGKEIAFSISKQQNVLVLSINDQNVSSGAYFLQVIKKGKQEILPLLKIK